IGRVSPASHGGGSEGGSHKPGPTRRTPSGQSPRGYSNGSAVKAMKMSAFKYWSSNLATGASPASVRKRLNGRTSEAASRSPTHHQARSRRRPIGPRAGRSPRPCGGASAERNAGG